MAILCCTKMEGRGHRRMVRQMACVGAWRAGWVLLSVLCWQRLDLGQHPLRVTFLDVGQGDSTLIEMPHSSVWLVDGGGIPSYMKSDFDVGERIVVPALAARGIDPIDVLVLTHADEDHVRGAAAVLQHFTVRQVVVSDVGVKRGEKEEGKAFTKNSWTRSKTRHPDLSGRSGQTFHQKRGYPCRFGIHLLRGMNFAEHVQTPTPTLSYSRCNTDNAAFCSRGIWKGRWRLI